MKTARERAEEVFASLDRTAQLAIKYDGGGVDAWMARTELSFKEHARDQRHLCAESVGNPVLYTHTTEGDYLASAQEKTAAFARVAAMNAPAPGEK